MGSLVLNVALPLVAMGLAWNGDARAFYSSPLRACMAGLFVLPNLTLVLFTTGYGPHARNSTESPWFIATANLMANGGMLAAIFMDANGWWRLPGGEGLRLPGLVVLALGTALRVATMLALGRMFSLRVSVEPDHELVTGGLYRWVRHPSYAAVIVLCLGVMLVLRSGIWALLIPSMLFGLTRRMQTEERFLLEQFGERYRVYMARTARLVPGIW
jgi:protein-S-isoprenylcysteine O-methyltransferase Ste14